MQSRLHTRDQSLGTCPAARRSSLRLPYYRPSLRQHGSTNAAAVSVPAQFTPHKVAIFVEPSPFSHISGMKNRFESLIKTLREAGDDVMVVTPDPKPPKEFCGAQVCMCSLTIHTPRDASCAPCHQSQLNHGYQMYSVHTGCYC
eukprot:GHUV01046669.1.p1 GENE.GHUV01046669.1~~GHUV01046669.1.p1  ORF type:complete len:144 (-),score=18.06 GHUV01046669.1:52-483(-)